MIFDLFYGIELNFVIYGIFVDSVLIGILFIYKTNGIGFETPTAGVFASINYLNDKIIEIGIFYLS